MLAQRGPRPERPFRDKKHSDPIGEGWSRGCAVIGFAHQTLFEHAWSRAFARERCSLAEYTLTRQDGLFIRSTAWAGLTYLRGADPANYRRELGRLWNRTDLRRHLRQLLVEFLGGVGEPDAQEQVWHFGALVNRELEGKILSAVRGNPRVVCRALAEPSAPAHAGGVVVVGHDVAPSQGDWRCIIEYTRSVAIRQRPSMWPQRSARRSDTRLTRV
jgi:hypothetical protein